MVDSNFYVDNPANVQMHNGNRQLVGVIDFPDKLPVKRPYNYFETQLMYNSLKNDMLVHQKKANPDKAKKGVPKIIKIAIAAVLATPLIVCGIKGIKCLIAKIRH